MDNKQDRQFFNKVKDFLGQNHSVSPKQIPSNSVNASIKNILEHNKIYRPINFNPVLNSQNLIDATLKSMQSIQTKGSPTNPGNSKNITGNAFTTIKEGVFDIIANDEEQQQEMPQQDLVSLPKPGEIPALIATPTVEPGASATDMYGKTTNVAPLPPGPNRAATPQFSMVPKNIPTGVPLPANTTPTQPQSATPMAKPSAADSTGDAEAQSNRGDIVDTLRAAGAMPGGYGEGGGESGAASRRQARQSRNAAIAAANISASREREKMQDAIKAAPDAETKSKLRGELRTFHQRTGVFQSNQQGNITQSSVATRYAPKNTAAPGTSVGQPTNQATQTGSMPKPAIAGVDTEGPPSSLATGSAVNAKTEKLTTPQPKPGTPKPTASTTPAPRTAASQGTTPTPGAGARETLGLGRTEQTTSPAPSLAGEMLGLGRSTQQTEETPAQKRARELLQR